MKIKWKEFDKKARNIIIDTISIKTIYKLKLRNNQVITAIVEDKRFILNTADRKRVNIDEIVGYAEFGSESDDLT